MASCKKCGDSCYKKPAKCCGKAHYCKRCGFQPSGKGLDRSGNPMREDNVNKN